MDGFDTFVVPSLLILRCCVHETINRHPNHYYGDKTHEWKHKWCLVSEHHFQQKLHRLPEKCTSLPVPVCLNEPTRFVTTEEGPGDVFLDPDALAQSSESDELTVSAKWTFKGPPGCKLAIIQPGNPSSNSCIIVCVKLCIVLEHHQPLNTQSTSQSIRKQ